ncbi:MAG TPA: right-handed parallel beta-helix repeat-containing protein [Candidatus Bathyarchaeia archaeon]|nr:right-handed parallel beta-helix repeat-containing protein [Candidatus Bathyarchaeia archaeon]
MKINKVTKRFLLSILVISALFIIKGKTITADNECDFFVDNQHAQASDGYLKEENSQDKPWLTIQRGVNLTAAGETVCIKSGVYNEKVTIQKSNPQDQWFTILSYPDQSAVIDGQGIEFGDSGGLLWIKDSSYIKIAGFKVINSDNAAILVTDSSYVNLENNLTRESESSGIGFWQSSHVVAKNNQIINARNAPYCPTCEDAGGHEESLSVADTEFFEVADNELFYDGGFTGYFGDAGIDVKESSRFGKVYGNYIHDITQDGGIYLDTWDAGLEGRPTLNEVEVYRNLLDSSGIRVGSERGGTAENIKIYNNIVLRSSFLGIGILRQKDGLRKNILIANNTIYEATGHGGAGIYIIAKNIENINIKNNIVAFGWGDWTSEGWSSGHAGQITLSGSDIADKVTASNNITFGPDLCSQDYPDCRHLPGINVDPLFAGRTSNNFHLLENSPAIDAGLDLVSEGITSDYDGNSRPQGSRYDLGAYEFSTVVEPGCGNYNLTGDNTVDYHDAVLLFQNINTPNLPEADFNSDGKVNLFDLSKIINCWKIVL